MAQSRIICVGNRYAEHDDVGPRVHDLLRERPLPAGVELVDGGLGGLNLLPWVEGARRVVFVDAVEGFGRPGAPLALDGEAVVREGDPAFGHGEGLAFLLKSLPAICPAPRPEVLLAGFEGPAGAEGVQALAALALALAAGEVTPARSPEPEGR